MIYADDRISDIYNQPHIFNDVFFELCICLTLRQIGIHNLISPSPFELAIEFSIIRTSLSLSLPPRYYDPQINEEGALEIVLRKGSLLFGKE